MAVISASIGQTPEQFTNSPQVNVFGFSSVNAVSTVDCASITISGSQAIQALYRGVVFSQFVYSLGSPPQGATDIIIVGYPDGED